MVVDEKHQHHAPALHELVHHAAIDSHRDAKHPEILDHEKLDYEAPLREAAAHKPPKDGPKDYKEHYYPGHSIAAEKERLEHDLFNPRHEDAYYYDT